MNSTGSKHVVIVGAGPYGVSLAAHLREARVPFRIFGRPMLTWATQMPAGMKLKSDGFASNLTSGSVAFTFEDFCHLTGRPYHATQLPVAVEDFVAYGREFARRFVPSLDHREVSCVQADGSDFLVSVEGGEQLRCRHVVIATGVSLYKHLPPVLSALPRTLVTHASEVQTFAHLSGKRVAVVGRGASALNAAVLLAEEGAKVTLVSRSRKLHVHTQDDPAERSWLQRVRHPMSPLGPGLRSCLSYSFPQLFHKLPFPLRRMLTWKHLGPAGGAALQGRIQGRFTRLMGWSLVSAQPTHGGHFVNLGLVAGDGTRRELHVAHVVAGTGYRVDIDRLSFLTAGLRGCIRLLPTGSPRLDASFGSSVRRLYFVGPAAAACFGPSQRFAAGAEFASRRLTRHLAHDYQRVHQRMHQHIHATQAVPETLQGIAVTAANERHV